ncbi:MAG TPA: hypothetical protein VF656_18155 [Pyrinomonadaceae bacterium]
MAIFEGIDLLYYATKDLGKNRQGSTAYSLAREAVRVVDEIINKYQPAALAIRILHPLQQLSPKLVRMTSELKMAGQRQGLFICECAPSDARKLLCPDGCATRRNAAARLASLYPELARYVTGVSCWQRLYYEPMFDAIAIGYCWQVEKAREAERLQLAANNSQFQYPKHKNTSAHYHVNS